VPPALVSTTARVLTPSMASAARARRSLRVKGARSMSMSVLRLAKCVKTGERVSILTGDLDVLVYQVRHAAHALV